MQQENDFIEREIQKLANFLKQIIQNLSGKNGAELDNAIEIINIDLKDKLDFSIFELIESENDTFYEKIEKLDKQIIENLSVLFYTIIEKSTDLNKKQELNMRKMIDKTFLMIDFLDNNSNIFSLNRMNMKNQLKKLLPKTF
ncbi:hypothetical protein [Lutibacter sp. B1]|uniref:hypothetical protein n=1 Tax=Lutibacter sp. B1 TaxID=2725996 RepID=UPI0014567C3F|nr:hypothetical protein [Lutibacter sp. B1]NLP59387.1 hypothetical protein [Lutibacter sp. B1]